MPREVYPEDAEIARLERILGKGAKQALDEYGFGDLFSPGTNDLTKNPQQPTAVDEDTSSTYSQSSDDHVLPAFLKAPDYATEDAESSDSNYIEQHLPNCRIGNVGYSAITKHINKLVETNIEDVVNGILGEKALYSIHGDLGLAVANQIVDTIKDSSDQSSTMCALFGAFISCLHIRDPQVCSICVSSLYVSLYAAIKESPSFSSVAVASTAQVFTAADDIASLVINLTEILSYAIAFRGAAVTPLGDILDVLLRVNVLISMPAEDGLANIEFYTLSPAVYRLISKVLRIADSLLLKFCSTQYKTLSKRISADSKMMKDMLSCPNITVDQKRFAVKLQVYEAVLKEARAVASRGSQMEPANPNIRSIYEFVRDVRHRKQAVLHEQSLADCIAAVKAPRTDGSGAENPASGPDTTASVMAPLWNKQLDIQIQEAFETGPMRRNPPTSTGARYTESETTVYKLFCFILPDVEEKLVDRDRITRSWSELYRNTSIPDSVFIDFKQYCSTRLKYLSSQEGIEHNIRTFCEKPLHKLAIPPLFITVLNINAEGAYIDHTLLLLLRSIIAAPGRHDFRHQLGLAIWDYVGTFSERDSRQISNTARFVAYLVGCPTTLGVHGISYSIFKKHILCDSNTVQTKSTRSSLLRAMQTFYDFLFCFLLTGKTHRLGDSVSGSDLYHAKMAFGPLITQNDQGLLAYSKNEEKDTDGMARVRRGVLLYLDELLSVYTKGDKVLMKIVGHLYPESAVFVQHCSEIINLLLERVKRYM